MFSLQNLARKGLSLSLLFFNVSSGATSNGIILLQQRHMVALESQVTGNSTVCSTHCSDEQQNSSALLTLVKGIRQIPWRKLLVLCTYIIISFVCILPRYLP